jgi:hypothetical protein
VCGPASLPNAFRSLGEQADTEAEAIEGAACWFRKEVDACGAAAPTIAEQYEPGEALERWLNRFIEFVAAKRGLSAALHSAIRLTSPCPGI